MFASMIPIYGRAVRGNLARLPPTPVNHCEGSQSSAGRENRERRVGGAETTVFHAHSDFLSVQAS